MLDNKMAVGQNQWYHFGVGEFTTHCRTYFSGGWDVWGLTDLGFDPWPNKLSISHVPIFPMPGTWIGSAARVRPKGAWKPTQRSGAELRAFERFEAGREVSCRGLGSGFGYDLGFDPWPFPIHFPFPILTATGVFAPHVVSFTAIG